MHMLANVFHVTCSTDHALQIFELGLWVKQQLSEAMAKANNAMTKAS